MSIFVSDIVSDFEKKAVQLILARGELLCSFQTRVPGVVRSVPPSSPQLPRQPQPGTRRPRGAVGAVSPRGGVLTGGVGGVGWGGVGVGGRRLLVLRPSGRNCKGAQSSPRPASSLPPKLGTSAAQGVGVPGSGRRWQTRGGRREAGRAGGRGQAGEARPSQRRSEQDSRSERVARGRGGGIRSAVYISQSAGSHFGICAGSLAGAAPLLAVGRRRGSGGSSSSSSGTALSAHRASAAVATAARQTRGHSP